VGPNQCDCPWPWTGVGEFAYSSPSCAVYLPATAAFWALALFSLSLLFPLAVYNLNHCAYEWRRGDKIHRGEWLSVACTFAFCVCGLVTCALRLARPLVPIGTGVIVTLAFALVFFFQAVVFLDMSRKVVTMNTLLVPPSNPLYRRMRWVRRYIFVSLVPIMGTTSVLFIAMLFSDSYATSYNLTAAHFVGYAATLLAFNAMLVVLIFNPFVRVIKEGIAARLQLQAARPSTQADADIKRILATLQTLQSGWMALSLTIAVYSPCFGFIPVLNRAGPSYVFPLSVFFLELLTAVNVALSLKRSALRRAPLFILLLARLLGNREVLQSSRGGEAAVLPPAPKAADKRDKRRIVAGDRAIEISSRVSTGSLPAALP